MTTPAQTVMSESAARDFIPPTVNRSAARLFVIVGWQTVAGLALAAAVALLAGSTAGWSSLLGTGVYLVPALAFAAFIAAGMALGKAPRVQLHGFYVGEVFKLAITVVLFAVVFTTVRTLEPLYFFTGFIVTQATMIAVLLRG